MRGWWNDNDGVSITEWLAAVVIVIYAGMLMLTGFKLLKGTLSERDIALIGQITIPVTTVLGGYFVDRTARRFVRGAPVSEEAAPAVTREPVLPSALGGKEMDYGSRI